MVDREKVIKGLEICYTIGETCENCPYYDLPVEQSCNDTLCLDALELLKEQEPVKPIGFENWWKCPSCRGNIVANMKYCPGCGRQVKWVA